VIPASALILTSTQFLFCAQDGTPQVLYIMLPVLILLFGHMAGSTKELRLPALLILAALLATSLYTPFLIYFVAAIGIISLLHPRIRLAFRTAKPIYLWGALSVFAIGVLPLVVATICQPDIMRLLLTNHVADINIWANFQQFFASLFLSNAQADSLILGPLYGLPIAALIVVGLVFGVQQRHRTKYYVLAGWLLIATGLMLIDPSLTVLVFTPFALLTTKGLAIVIQKWYSLFPTNPYARLGGLAPIAFLVIGMSITSANHFMMGYHYSPQIAKHHNNDITLVRQHLQTGAAILVTPGSLEYSFYKILEQREPVNVVSQLPSRRPTSLITIGKQALAAKTNLKLVQIVTSSHTDQPDRLYIYGK
jgi:hypothetical protein